MKPKTRLSSWWRKDGAVFHRYYGQGTITNFVGCPKGCANVYFYAIDSVQQDIDRNELVRSKVGFDPASRMGDPILKTNS